MFSCRFSADDLCCGGFLCTPLKVFIFPANCLVLGTAYQEQLSFMLFIQALDVNNHILFIIFVFFIIVYTDDFKRLFIFH